MKIAIIDWEFFGKQDIADALSGMGHTITYFSHPDYDSRESASFCQTLNDFLKQENADIVYSSNYFPLVSTVCNTVNIPYVSWVYDCPHLSLFSATILNRCNFVFIFDSDIFRKLYAAGIDTVYYLPLAANVSRLCKMTPTADIHRKLDADISFVGSLYNEKHNLFERFEGIGDYTRGYLEGIIDAQLKVSGYNFIEEVLLPDIVSDLQNTCPYTPNIDGVETPEYIYAKYFIDRKITSIERHNILKALSDNFSTKLYTHNRPDDMDKIEFVGPVDAYTTQPYVFKCSKINLNITLKSIQNGIPLRVFDIMGAGGFLMTNFQADMLDLFVPEEDFVFYDGIDDLIEKCSFYLRHEELRMQIAQNGYNKIKAHHTYEMRFKDIFDIMFRQVDR